MEFSENQKKIFYGIAIIIISVIGYFIMRTGNNSEETYIYEKNYNEMSIESIKENDVKEIIVHVAGCVRNEGIVKIKEGSRVYEAVEEAGGLLEEADLRNINLAYIVTDGQKIYIPSINEEQIVEEKYEFIDDKDTFIKSKININTATKEELKNIPGIGETTAKNIIEYRKENGDFEELEELMEVSGIGENKYNQIKEYITL